MTTVAELAEELAACRTQLEAARQELAEARAQQAATAEILAVMNESATDPQRVLDTIAETSGRLSGAVDSIVWRRQGDEIIRAAGYGPLDKGGAIGHRGRLGLGQGAPPGRAITQRRTIHAVNPADDPDWPDGFRRYMRREGIRVVLAVPMIREGEAIGALALRRVEPRPFTDREIERVTTFASQAAIVIENARLFSELQDRQRELEERNTAL